VFSRNQTITITALLLGAFLYHQWNKGEKFSEFMAVRESPVQSRVSDPVPFDYKNYTITPQAEFKIKAVVLSSQGYWMDRESKLAPVDLALGWGPMSNGQVLKDLKISQDNRWYYYRYQELPIPDAEIIAHSANMHLIPATPEIEGKIKAARHGHIVEFSGYLVNVNAPDGWGWRSSQSRNDTGGGSCELVWVTGFERVEQP
jgi:hypothetical protein